MTQGGLTLAQLDAAMDDFEAQAAARSASFRAWWAELHRTMDDPRLSCPACYDIAHDELDERQACDEHAED